jgi:integrase/recombinase XerD
MVRSSVGCVAGGIACDQAAATSARRARAPTLRDDDPRELSQDPQGVPSTHWEALDHVGPDDLRRYQVYLLEDRRLAVGTVVAQLAALRFFYLRVLKRLNMKEDLPYPKRPSRLPIILSPDEVQRLIAGARNLFHRTILMTLYGGGLRRSELLHLKVADIDSQRMVLRIERGKGGHDREVPLSPTLLTALREYWLWMRPQTYLFPGTRNGWRADKPLNARVIWDAVRFAALTAGIDKHVSPHTLRVTFELQSSFEDRVLGQALAATEFVLCAYFARSGASQDGTPSSHLLLVNRIMVPSLI